MILPSKISEYLPATYLVNGCSASIISTLFFCVFELSCLPVVYVTPLLSLLHNVNLRFALKLAFLALISFFVERELPCPKIPRIVLRFMGTGNVRNILS